MFQWVFSAEESEGWRSPFKIENRAPNTVVITGKHQVFIVDNSNQVFILTIVPEKTMIYIYKAGIQRFINAFYS